MRTVRTKVYKFSELDKKAQDTVIDRRINEIMECEHEYYYKNWPEYKKAIDKAEQMQTPWFAGSYVWEYCGKVIVADLSSPDSEIEYTKDGRLF